MSVADMSVAGRHSGIERFSVPLVKTYVRETGAAASRVRGCCKL